MKCKYYIEHDWLLILRVNDAITCKRWQFGLIFDNCAWSRLRVNQIRATIGQFVYA